MTGQPNSAKPGVLTWEQWFAENGLADLVDFPRDVGLQSWAPTDADRKAAWELYTEMRTRISTQPLHYRAGVEQTALESVRDLFKITREVVRKYQYECRHFATVAVRVLNVVIRPYTAHWHKRSDAGAFATEDGRHEFRVQLQQLQAKLHLFQTFLGRLAEGTEFREGSESGLEEIEDQSFELGEAISYDRLLGLDTAVIDEELEDVADKKMEDAANGFMKKEQDEIGRRREQIGVGSGTDDLVGLAISGGGIRSATFALGVVQGLARHDLLKEVDLLSTVSGGGYLGSFLSSFWNDADNPAKSNPEIGPQCDKLPFRREAACESRALRFLRDHSRYLRPRGFWGGLTMAAQGLYGIFMNFVILSPLLIAAVLATYYAYPGQVRAAAAAVQNGHGLEFRPWIATLVVGTLWGVLVFLLPLVQKLGRQPGRWRDIRPKFEFACLAGFGLTLLVAGLNVVPGAHFAFLWISAKLHLYDASSQQFDWQAAGMAISNVVAFLSAKGLLWHSEKTDREVTREASLFRKVLFLLLWLSGPVFLAVVYFLLCDWLLIPQSGPQLAFGPISIAWLPLLWMLVVLIPTYTFGFLNINLISPYRYYRNRLVDTYLLRHNPDAADGAGVESVDGQLLTDLGRTGKAPYHLINATVNLPSSTQPELRGRDGDFFLFSKHVCGSPILGYQATSKWQRFDAHFDLGTAMAISGAAASPQMGASTPRGASFFLTLLNVRLGVWLRQPRPDDPVTAARVKKWGGPGPFYLLREMFGRVHEKTDYVNVSDGGHIENLGIYELLRRRCKFIVAIDGECDPQLEFGSLMQLLRYAWIDFGVRIDINVDELRLTPAHFSQAHSALGRIHYHTGETGYLLYLKLSVTGNELPYVLDYRRQNPAFPHQSTTDQLFEEDQFEAYRALGSHVAEELFREELLGPDGADDLTVRRWFEQLGKSLLGT